MLIPLGGESSENVNVLVGISASVAEALTFRVVNSLIVWFVGTVRTGGVLTSWTVTVKELVALIGGEPLSVTTTVIKLVLGP